MAMQSVNPATGAVVQGYAEMKAEDVSRTIRAAHEAFLSWRKRSFAERAAPPNTRG